jgi:hypothetical protein
MLNEQIVKALAVTLELTNTRLSEPAMEAMAEHLSQYPAAQILSALARCQTECRRPIYLADVLDRIADGRPGPEAAWNLVRGTTDADTVVWTDEIAEAWAACRFLLDDPVAARMAFLEVYRQRLAVEKAQASEPQWLIYLGEDRARRAGPVLAAVAAGQVSIAQGKGALAPEEWPATWHGDRQLTEDAIPRAQLVALIEDLVQQVADTLRTEHRAGRPPLLARADPDTLRGALDEHWKQGT